VGQRDGALDLAPLGAPRELPRALDDLGDACLDPFGESALAEARRGPELPDDEVEASLQQLLELKSGVGLQSTSASVIGSAADPNFRSLTIDKGTADGLRPDMAVIAPAGVVGRIITPSARAAKVQLLIDRNAAAGALVERSRAQGVVEGTGGGLRMNYVSGTADILVGDTVLTSGIDGIYPKGFVIGQIQSVERGQGVFGAIGLRPAVDFSSLEAVLVVLMPPAAADDGAIPAGGAQGPQ